MTQEAATIQVTHSLRIPAGELQYRTSRSGGPGGQHVNTTDTQVELTWDITTSPTLNEGQRTRLLSKLANRVDARGNLHVKVSDSRSQVKNKKIALERFKKLVSEALHIPRPRKATKPSKAAKEKRLKGKKQRGEIKAMRKRVR